MGQVGFFKINMSKRVYITTGAANRFTIPGQILNTKTGEMVNAPTQKTTINRGKSTEEVVWKDYQWPGVERLEFEVDSPMDKYLQAYLSNVREGQENLAFVKVHSEEIEAKKYLKASTLKKLAQRELDSIAEYDFEKELLEIKNRISFDALALQYGMSVQVPDILRFNKLSKEIEGPIDKVQQFVELAKKPGESHSKLILDEMIRYGVLRKSDDSGEAASGAFYFFMPQGPNTPLEDQVKIGNKRTVFSYFKSEDTEKKMKFQTWKDLLELRKKHPSEGGV